MTRPRLPSNEVSLSSSKTMHRRTSSVICNGKIHSDRNDSIIHFDEGNLRPGSDVISSLRALELIRQLSFDISTPKIIDMLADTENIVASPSTVSKYLPGFIEVECVQCVPPAPPCTPRIVSPPLPPIAGRKEPRAVSPPINDLVVNKLDRARSTSVSEMSDSDGYVTDFDGMMVVMDPLPDQTGQPNRHRLPSDQSPYAISSASSSSCYDHSSASSTEREKFHFHDPIGCVINLEVTGPPSCTRLSIDSLQEWNLLCEQEGNIINKRQYIATALSPTTRPTLIDGEHPSSSLETAEEVHMMCSDSFSYTHTGAPSTVSISSEVHNVEEDVISSNYDGEPALSYSQSNDKSFESSLVGDIDRIHQDTAVANTRNRHRRHKSDGSVFLPRSNHQRRNSLDKFLHIIPESPNGVDIDGHFVRTTSPACDNSFEGFVTTIGVPLEQPCSTNMSRVHRRFNSDGHLVRRGRRLQQSNVHGVAF